MSIEVEDYQEVSELTYRRAIRKTQQTGWIQWVLKDHLERFPSLVLLDRIEMTLSRKVRSLRTITRWYTRTEGMGTFTEMIFGKRLESPPPPPRKVWQCSRFGWVPSTLVRRVEDLLRDFLTIDLCPFTLTIWDTTKHNKTNYLITSKYLHTEDPLPVSPLYLRCLLLLVIVYPFHGSGQVRPLHLPTPPVPLCRVTCRRSLTDSRPRRLPSQRESSLSPSSFVVQLLTTRVSVSLHS